MDGDELRPLQFQCACLVSKARSIASASRSLRSSMTVEVEFAAGLAGDFAMAIRPGS
jgi:hypothetical protein